MKKESPLRKVECPKYADCLDVAAHQNKNFDCRECENFSKWPYLKKIDEPIETKININPGIQQKEVEMIPEKMCRECKKTKPSTEFSKNKAIKDGFDPYCRQCKSDIHAAYVRRKNEKACGGDGRRKPGKRQFVTRAGHPLKIAVPLAPIQGIYLHPAIIKAIQKSAAKQIMKEFSEFLEERYS